MAQVDEFRRRPRAVAQAGHHRFRRMRQGLEAIEARYIPGLKADLVTQRIFTPKDFERELNAWQGSAFSLEPVLTQSAWFRTHNRDDVIPNLYFVGAGTHPGAGVPGVIGSAKATAGLMIADAQSKAWGGKS